MGVTEVLRAPIIAIDCGLAKDTSQTGGPDAFADAFALVTFQLLLLSQFQCSFEREREHLAVHRVVFTAVALLYRHLPCLLL